MPELGISVAIYFNFEFHIFHIFHRMSNVKLCYERTEGGDLGTNMPGEKHSSTVTETVFVFTSTFTSDIRLIRLFKTQFTSLAVADQTSDSNLKCKMASGATGSNC